MFGELEAPYWAARKALLDAWDALQGHADAVVLVGAQAVYLWAGESPWPVAPFTLDADLALHPALLKDEPLLLAALAQAGFLPHEDANRVGSWVQSHGGAIVDLLVPESLAPGRRAAQLGRHGDRSARRVAGLEAAMVDKQRLSVGALDPQDARKVSCWVAGPAALTVAKLHKLAERSGGPRQKNKDALDLHRLLISHGESMPSSIQALRKHPETADSTQAALGHLRLLFGSPQAEGCRMVATALGALPEAEAQAQACSFLAQALLEGVA